MSTQAAAPAEAAASAAPAPLPDNTSAAASKFVEAIEAKAKAPDKAATAKPEKPAEPQKPRIDPNLVKREREATEKLQRAEAIEAKFAPLTEALAKRNLTAALNLMAKDHGVTFADFVAVLKDSGNSDETLEAKAERIARETIDKAKAEDAAKAEQERQANDAAAKKTFDDRLAKFRETCQAKAEGDPARWKQAAVNGSGDKAWEVIESFHAATGGKLDVPEALDVVEESWNLVHAHFAETKQRLSIDKAVQLIVGELAKLGAEGARAKLQEAQTAGASGNTRNEADGQKTNGGRAAVPSLSNRTTSGTGVRPARDPNEPVRFDKSAVNDAIARALPHLANA